MLKASFCKDHGQIMDTNNAGVTEDTPTGMAPTKAPHGLDIVHLGLDFLDVYPEAIANFVSCTGIKRNSTNHRLSRVFPAYTKDYKRRCLRKHLRTGEAAPFDTGAMFGTRFIISLPIRDHWRETLTPQNVKDAVVSLISCCKDLGVSSLAVPIVEGPPAGWLEGKIASAAAEHPNIALKTVYLFKEE
jgi:hypothetical protein